MRIQTLACIFVVTALAAATQPAHAADVTLELKTAAGQPVRDAVASIYPSHGDLPQASSRFNGPFRIVQEQLQFHPFVLLVPVGAMVGFPNLDRIRHHVYSFSPAKTFELKLYGQDDKRLIQFDKAGVVAVGCNIHDRMSAFVYVVDTPYAAKSDERGRIVIRDLPDGAATIRIWHPYLKAINQTLTRPATLRSGYSEHVVVDLKPAPPGMMGN